MRTTSTRKHRDRAVVLIMVVAILVTLTMAATAFVIYMRQVDQAASNVRDAAQAELSARSGLEHAIRVIEEAVGLYVYEDGAIDAAGNTYSNPDLAADGAKAGWYMYFKAPPTETIVEYDAGHVITGRRFGFPVDSGTSKRGEYVVSAVDLDGKLHADLDQWDKAGHAAAARIPALIRDVAVAGIGTTRAQLLVNHSTGTSEPEHPRAFSSLGEMARRAEANTVAKGKYQIERLLTVYPVRGLEAIAADVTGNVPGVEPDTSEITLTGVTLLVGEHVGGSVVFDGSTNEYPIKEHTPAMLTVVGDSTVEGATKLTIHLPRPAVNINTTPATLVEALLVELLKPIESFKDPPDPLGQVKAEALAKHLVAMRPFVNRHELEDAVRRVSGDDGVKNLYEYVATLPDPTFLTERQFNDVLNSFAGVLGYDDSAYDEPLNPGVYSFDGWAPYQAGEVGPSQIGGRHTDHNNMDVDATGVPLHNLTWSTELKFTSRFFHIYALGRGWEPRTETPVGTRRVHAVYDSKKKRIIWLRWNVSSRGSVSDL